MPRPAGPKYVVPPVQVGPPFDVGCAPRLARKAKDKQANSPSPVGWAKSAERALAHHLRAGVPAPPPPPPRACPAPTAARRWGGGSTTLVGQLPIETKCSRPAGQSLSMPQP